MTTTWAGGTSLSEYDARIRRAERLSAQHSFASEFLNFYNTSARSKKRFARHRRCAGTKSSNISVAELRVLSTSPSSSPLPWLLSTMNNVPRRVGKSSASIVLAAFGFLIASLESYWQHGGKYDQQVGASRSSSPGFLQPYADFVPRCCRRLRWWLLYGFAVVRRASTPGRACGWKAIAEKNVSCFCSFCSRVGVPPDSLPHLWRTGRRQAAGVRSGTTAPHPCRSLRCPVSFFSPPSTDQRRPRHPYGRRSSRDPLTTLGP